jgi:hypothetical protein
MKLAQDGFANSRAGDRDVLVQIDTLIGEIDNDALLAVLRQSGQGYSFGSLRHFLTVLKFIAHRHEDHSSLPPEFAYDLAQAAGIIAKACNSQPSENPTAAQNGGLEGATGARPSRRWHAQSAWVRDINAEIRKHRDQLRLLGVVLVGLVLAVLLAITGHFTMIALRVILRGRSICDIPMMLDFMGDRFDGRIMILGKLGCLIVLDLPPDNRSWPEISRGTYLNVVVDGQILNARTLHESSDEYRVMFSTPLTRKKLRQILATSLIPVRYDLGFLNRQKIGGQLFGTGSLPKV